MRGSLDLTKEPLKIPSGNTSEIVVTLSTVQRGIGKVAQRSSFDVAGF